MPATEPRTCEHCNKTVIGVCLCNHVAGTPIDYTARTNSEVLATVGRALWLELHSRNMTPEEFARWRLRVPSYGCNCRRKLDEYIETHPVDYDNFYSWGCDLHDFINNHLGKPVWDRVS